MGDAHRRDVEDGAEMECESGPAGVVAAGGVDEQDLGPVTKGTYGGFEYRAFA